MRVSTITEWLKELFTDGFLDIAMTTIIKRQRIFYVSKLMDEAGQ
jgi:hypothetical protein